MCIRDRYKYLGAVQKGAGNIYSAALSARELANRAPHKSVEVEKL